MQRQDLTNTRRWVIKVGSSLVTDDGKGLNTELIQLWSEQIASLRQAGIECVLVSSGSIAAGVQHLGWDRRPAAIHKLQVAAAVGQASLMRCYEQVFAQHGITAAQVLLTHADMQNRQRYLNARATFRSMLEFGVLPIVNENDTVAVDELRFGDNDSLAAMVANLIDADVLAILTDQQGLFDDNPSKNPAAKFIEQADARDKALMSYASEGGALGSGGMVTKIRAAQIASRSGASTLIANGRLEKVLNDLHAGENIGTLLVSHKDKLASRKQWMANQLHVKGSLTLDAGAARVVTESGKSLLPVGVTQITGEFDRGELVSCITPDGEEIARGLVNYTASETAKIIGKPSADIAELLGYAGDAELIHRDNLVLF